MAFLVMGGVVVVGNLAQNAVTISAALKRNGHAPTVWVTQSEWNAGVPKGLVQEIGGSSVCIYRPQRFRDYPWFQRKAGWVIARINRFLNELRAIRLILGALFAGANKFLSFTATLAGHGVWRRIFIDWGLLSYAAAATGSDLRELAFEKSDKGRKTAHFFRRAQHVFIMNTDMVQAIHNLGIRKWSFLPFAIDTDFFCPAPKGQVKIDGVLRILLISRLDWGMGDAHSLKWGKGSDRFLRAFARFVREGTPAELTVIRSGPDLNLAERLIAEEGIVNHVRFVERMNRGDIRNAIRCHDVVADQFDIGAAGSGAIEALSCGKPLLIHLIKDHAQACYGEVPPVLTCSTEDEILVRLHECVDSGNRNRLGHCGRQWAVKHHSFNHVAEIVSRGMQLTCA